MSNYSEYEAGYDAALEAVADGEVDAKAKVREMRNAQRRRRELITTLGPDKVDRARSTVAALAVRNTATDAEAVEATRDVLDVLGIGAVR